MTSMIPLFVLVLATYCYALPLQVQNSTFTTPIQEYSTGVTIVEHAVKVNMRLISPEESNDIPNIHPEHKDDEDHSEHMPNDELARQSRLSPQWPFRFTTQSPFHSEHMPTDEVSHPSQVSDEMASRFTTQSPYSFHSEHMPIDEVSRPSRLAEKMSSGFTTQSPLSFNLKHDARSLNEESQDAFDERSINNLRNQERSLEMTTVAEPLASTSFDFHPRELTTSVEGRPQEFTTSADSFGKFTGLLSNDETTEAMRLEQTTQSMKFEQSTTAMKSEKDDSSMEETTEKPQQLIKTISFIPGKITTTQIFGNEASKEYFMHQPEQQQLTQGQKQSIVKTQKSNY